MQLRHLETFLAIVDGGTLTNAATALFKTQAAISQDLKALEGSLGVVLIDRSGQRVEVTPAGTALIPMARRVLSEVSETESEMARIQAGESPIVRIACLPSVATKVARLIGDFYDSNPDVRWSLVTALRGAMIDGLRERRFDLAICEAYVDDGITNTPLAREPLKVVVRKSHSLSTRAVVRPEDLVGVPYIGLARGMGATLEAQRFFASSGTYPTPTVEVNDAGLVLDLVVRLDGFGVLPVSAVTDDPALTTVDTDPPLVRQLSLARLTDRHLHSSATKFVLQVANRWSTT